jgi:hypothetical protein
MIVQFQIFGNGVVIIYINDNLKYLIRYFKTMKFTNGCKIEKIKLVSGFLKF